MTNNLLSLLAEADEASIRLEKARRELDAAKQSLESAKQSYDAVIARADEAGVPRAKLKRLTEERLAALLETGLMTLSPVVAVKESSNERPKKSRTKNAVPTEVPEEVKESEELVTPEVAYSEEPAAEASL